MNEVYNYLLFAIREAAHQEIMFEHFIASEKPLNTGYQKILKRNNQIIHNELAGALNNLLDDLKLFKKERLEIAGGHMQNFAAIAELFLFMEEDIKLHIEQNHLELTQKSVKDIIILANEMSLNIGLMIDPPGYFMN